MIAAVILLYVYMLRSQNDRHNSPSNMAQAKNQNNNKKNKWYDCQQGIKIEKMVCNAV